MFVLNVRRSSLLFFFCCIVFSSSFLTLKLEADFVLGLLRPGTTIFSILFSYLSFFYFDQLEPRPPPPIKLYQSSIIIMFSYIYTYIHIHAHSLINKRIHIRSCTPSFTLSFIHSFIHSFTLLVLILYCNCRIAYILNMSSVVTQVSRVGRRLLDAHTTPKSPPCPPPVCACDPHTYNRKIMRTETY